MKFCPNCGAKVQPGDKFCQNCGYKLNAKSNKTVLANSSTNDDQHKNSTLTKKAQKNSKDKSANPADHSNKQKIASTMKVLSKKVNAKASWNKIKKTIRTNPKKYSIIGIIVLIVLIIVGVKIHNIEMQPDHALINKPYVMTIDSKTSTSGLFTTSTESNTVSYVIYLNRRNKECFIAKNLSKLNQIKKSSDSGVNYSLNDDTLKITGSDDFDNVQVNNIHRSGDSYVGTLKQISDEDSTVSGKVTFHKAS